MSPKELFLSPFSGPKPPWSFFTATQMQAVLVRRGAADGCQRAGRARKGGRTLPKIAGWLLRAHQHSLLSPSSSSCPQRAAHWQGGDHLSKSARVHSSGIHEPPICTRFCCEISPPRSRSQTPAQWVLSCPHKRLWPCATQVRLSLGKADGSPQFSEGEKEQEPSVPAITFLPLLLLENIISVSHFVHQMPKNLGGERHNPARMAHGCATAWCSSSNEPASVCAGHRCHRGRQQGPGMARCHHTAVSSRE